MYKRGLTDDIIDKFDIGYDKSTDSITFPVTDLYGNVKWIQTRSVRGKFYRIPEGIIKTDYLYGVYQALETKSTSIAICESCFTSEINKSSSEMPLKSAPFPNAFSTFKDFNISFNSIESP